MTELVERTLAWWFGLLGGALLLIGSLVAFLLGVADLALGHTVLGIGSVSQAIVLFVVGGLVLFFTYLGHGAWSARPLSAGILLVVLAVVGWALLGLGANPVALVGALFAFLAGILFLVEPTRKAVASAASG